jgi:hypothetical protein
MSSIDRENLDVTARVALEAAEKEHGERRVALVMTDEGAVIVRRPHRLNVQKFMDAEKITSAAMMALVKSCVVYPDKDGFERLLDEQPAALAPITNVALGLAGSGAKALAGK